MKTAQETSFPLVPEEGRSRLQTGYGVLNALAFPCGTRAFVKTVIVHASVSPRYHFWVEPEAGQMQAVLISTTGVDLKGDTVLRNVADTLSGEELSAPQVQDVRIQGAQSLGGEAFLRASHISKQGEEGRRILLVIQKSRTDILERIGEVGKGFDTTRGEQPGWRQTRSCGCLTSPFASASHAFCLDIFTNEVRHAGTGDSTGVLFIVCGRFPQWYSCEGGTTFLGNAFGITYLPAADQGSSSAGQEEHRAECAAAHWLTMGKSLSFSASHSSSIERHS
ncbi:hypothetical protein H8959_010120, partial [Pygathrix nigripes]